MERQCCAQWSSLPLGGAPVGLGSTGLGLRGTPYRQGVLEGKGQLGLDPLFLGGQATVAQPALAWIKGRQLQLSGAFRYPSFDFNAELLPLDSGSVQLTSRGAWNGP